MGDETNRDSRATSKRKPDLTASSRMLRFWKGMTELFGQRWADSYGSEPGKLWLEAIDSLSDHELKDGIARLMKSGAQHPPTLPEFITLARGISRTQEWKPDPNKATDAECLASQWFLQRSKKFRFVGMPRDAHFTLHSDVSAIARAHLLLMSERDPAAVPQRFERLADEAAERIYPAARARQWLGAVRP